MSCNQRTGLYADWELEFCPPGPLLIKNMMLKLRTNDQRCLSSPNRCLTLQLADVYLSSPTFIKPNVSGSYSLLRLMTSSSPGLQVSKCQPPKTINILSLVFKSLSTVLIKNWSRISFEALPIF